jgi:hypothetical protein
MKKPPLEYGHQFAIALEVEASFNIWRQRDFSEFPTQPFARKRFWSKWTRDRQHFLSGRYVGGFMSTSHYLLPWFEGLGRYSGRTR